MMQYQKDMSHVAFVNHLKKIKQQKVSPNIEKETQTVELIIKGMLSVIVNSDNMDGIIIDITNVGVIMVLN